MNHFRHLNLCVVLLTGLLLAPFAPAAEGVIRVACVGDSITFGAGIRDYPTGTYPAQLGSWLGTNYDVRNFGVSGTTVVQPSDLPYVNQPAYGAALGFKPDVVVINFGANDSKHPGDGSLDAANAVNNWQYHTNFVGDYEAMIAAFRSANPKTQIYVCYPTPDFPGRWGINDRTIREELIPLIRTVAKDTGATVIDLYAALGGKADLFPDTVHPNEAGAKLMAATVYRALTGHDVPAAANPALRLLADQRVLWLGDSITFDGKYVSFVEYYLNKKFPDANFDFISIGLASETVSGLSEKSHPFPRPCVFERLTRALDAVQPATVIACYGMNDGIYHPQSPERMQAFEAGVQRLSREVRNHGAQLLLLTPPPFDPVPVKNLLPATAPDFSYAMAYSNYDSVLTDYSTWEKSLPPSAASVVVDLHSALGNYLKQQRQSDPAYHFSADGIHPSALGHLLMAQTILRGLGVDAGTGDLAADLKQIEADPLYQLIRGYRESRSAGWLDYVGYTRDQTVKTDSITQTEQSAAALQSTINQVRRTAPTQQ